MTISLFGTELSILSLIWLALDLGILSLLIFSLFFQGRSRSKTIKINAGSLPISPDHSSADEDMINREMDRTMDLLMLDLSEASPFNNEKEGYPRIWNHMARLKDLDTIRIEADFEEDLLP